MADLDSLSFALLVPFAVCFILIFIVCCYADEIKEICRLPSPLPSTYIGAEHAYSERRRRHHRRHNERHDRHRPERANREDDIQTLIINEEGRSRNVSESSAEYLPQQNVINVNEQGPSTSGGDNGSRIQSHVIISPVTSKTDNVALAGNLCLSLSSDNYTKNLSLGSQTLKQDKHCVTMNTGVTGNSCQRDSVPNISNTTSSVSSNSRAGVHSHSRSGSVPLPEMLSGYLTSGKFHVSSVPVVTELTSTSVDSTQKDEQLKNTSDRP